MVVFPVSNKLLPIYITGLGFNNKQKGTYRKNGYHDHQWIQTNSGRGILEVKNSKYRIGEKEGFLLPPYMEHSYYPTDREWNLDWVSFNGSSVDIYLNELNLQPFSLHYIKNNIISLLIFKALNVSSSLAASGVMHSSIMIQILKEISDQSFELHGNITPVIDYINNNYYKDISLGDMAGIMKITPQHFCRVFYDNMKLRPFQYVTKVRISKSKELMINNPLMSIESVAKNAGYSCSSYFCNVFKAYEGITPTEFRSLYTSL